MGVFLVFAGVVIWAVAGEPSADGGSATPHCLLQNRISEQVQVVPGVDEGDEAPDETIEPSKIDTHSPGIPEEAENEPQPVSDVDEETASEEKELSMLNLEGNINRSQSSVIAPAFVRLRTDSRYHGQAYIGVCGGFCSGFGVYAHGEHAMRRYHHPGTFTFALSGEARVGQIVRLQETSSHHARCLLGVCGHSGCENGYKMSCHSPSSHRVWRYPTTVDWEVVSGSFANGGSVRLRNVWHNCYVGACGGDGGCDGSSFGMSCHPVNSPRVSRYPDVFNLRVEQPGPITGTWKLVGQGHSAVGQVTYTAGLTDTSGSSVSTSLSTSVSTSITGTIGFDPLGSSVSSTVEMSVTSEVSRTYSTSRATSTSTAYQWTCSPSFAEGQWWMWQWAVEVPAWEGNSHATAQVKTTAVMCTKCSGGQTSCSGPVRPRCPLNFCADDACQRCRAGWQR